MRTAKFAKVLVDLDVAHLDQPFDYSIPGDLKGKVEVGSLVQVRFGGRLTPGYVLEVTDATEYSGKLAPIRRVITPIPVLTPAIIKVARYVASRYAVSLTQVLSLVVPARRAKVESTLAPLISPETRLEPKPSPRRSVVTVLPGTCHSLLVSAAALQADGGKRVIILMPTASQCVSAAQFFAAHSGLAVGLMHNDMEPSERYRVYLEALMGRLHVVVGTRSAVWLPMDNLGGIILCDSGSDMYEERRSPRTTALDVAVARSHLEGLDLLLPAYTPGIKAQYLVEQRWATERFPSREETLRSTPKIRFFGQEEAWEEGAAGDTRLPNAAYDLIRSGLEAGPVLIQVMAKGHTEQIDENDAGQVRIGAVRIGEELRKAFLGVRVTVSSSTAGIKLQVKGGPQIVVATAGAEPMVSGGYAAVVITGASAIAYGHGLDSKVDALRRWMAALALAKPRSQALLIGEVPEDLERALSNWNGAPVAKQTLTERTVLGFPPTRWVVSLEGDQEQVDEVLTKVGETMGEAIVSLPGEKRGNLSMLGFYDLGEGKLRVLLSAPNRLASSLMGSLAEVRRERSAKGQAPISIRVNPTDLTDPTA